MALTVVNVTDTINTFRLKTNEISANVGDRGNFLSGIATANVVEAINSVFKNANSAVNLIGDINLLDSDIINRNNIVSAINYVWANIDQGVYVNKTNGTATNLYVSGGTFNNANIFGKLVVANLITTNTLTTNTLITNNVVVYDNLIYFHNQTEGTYVAWDAGANAFRFAKGQANLALINLDGNPSSQNTLLTFRFANLHLAQNTNARMSNAYIANANLYYANIDHANVNDLIVTDNVITFGRTNGANLTWNPTSNAILFNNGGYRFGRLSSNNQLLDENTIMKVGLANIHYLQVNNTSVSNITIYGGNTYNLNASDNTYYFDKVTYGNYIRWEKLPGVGVTGHYVLSADGYEFADITYNGYPQDNNTLVSTKFGNVNYVTTVGNQNQFINGVKVFTDTTVFSASPGIWWDPLRTLAPIGVMGNIISSGHNNMYLSVAKTSNPATFWTYTYQADDGTISVPGNVYSDVGKVTLNDGTKVRELKANVLGLYLDGANIIQEPFGNVIYVTTTRNQTVQGDKTFTDDIVITSTGNLTVGTSEIILTDGTYHRELKSNVKGLYFGTVDGDGANIVFEETGNINYVTTTNDQFVSGVKSFTSKINDVNGTLWLNPGNSTTYPSGILESEHNNGTYTNLLTQKVRKNGLNDYWYTQFVGTDGAYIFPSNIVIQSGQIFLNDDAAAPVGEGTLHLFKANTKGLYYDNANIITEPYANINYVTTTRNQNITGSKTFVNTSGSDRTYFSGDIAFLGRGAGNILYWTDNGSNYSPSIYSESQNNLSLDVNSSSAASNIKLQAKTVYAPFILFGAQQIVKTVGIGTGATTIDLSLGNIFECNMSSSITSLSITNIQGNSGLTVSTAAIFVLKLSYTGSAVSVSWPASIKWPGGTAPALSSGSGKVDTFAFYTTNYGSTWYGFIVGQNS